MRNPPPSARAIALFIVAVLWVLLVPKSSFHSWGVFHYWLNAKYFDQLGYEALYSCALAADEGHVWPEPNFPVRDLRSYEMSTAAAEAGKCPTDRFTPAEWAAFTADLRFLQSTPEWDRYVLTDKGFNGTPAWVITAQAALWVLPLSWLVWVDMALILGAVGWIAYRAGLEKAALILLFVFSFWGTFGRVSGHFLQFLWLPLLLMGLLERQAGLLVMASAWQIFPAAALLDRRLAWRSPLTIGAVAVTGLVTLAAPLDWWVKFATNIGRHSQYIHRELLNIGLPNLLTTFGTPYSPPYTWVNGAVISPALLTLLAYPLIRYYRRSEHLYVPLFGLLTMSRYYYVGLAVLALDHVGWGYALLAWNAAAFVLEPDRFGWVQVGLYSLLVATLTVNLNQKCNLKAPA